MLNCEKCNYLKETNPEDKSGKYSCELTKFIFRDKDQFYDMSNHPCSYKYDEGQLLNC